jgi:hypothetical protein
VVFQAAMDAAEDAVLRLAWRARGHDFEPDVVGLRRAHHAAKAWDAELKAVPLALVTFQRHVAATLRAASEDEAAAVFEKMADAVEREAELRGTKP